MFLGPPRLRKWFGRQNNYRRTIQNTFKPRAYPSFTRRIPYDANNAAAEDNDNIETTIRQFRNYNNRPERFGRQLMFGPIRKSVVNDTRSNSEGSSSVVFGESLATRTMKQKKQRDNRVNQNRGIPPPPPPHKMRAAEGKSPNKNRYQVQLRPGSILTVSVANPQISISRQFKRSDGETSFLKDKWSAPKHEKFQPRGISLRYNFRAVANQTKMTLNERFSGLKIIKGNFTVTKSGSRTVTLP
ncbi:UAP56-interacting factor-like isoform X2 [Sarcophilus harrisii]|uniref:UAP56-interacting factor-like isoform X2 n=1 Tax=Sarcophilus harrisii TaxID=9305 RepID=UPI001301B9D2|nr:UAP56-interacting factor-like isoform X2 [Sarcophilus harrisii]